MRGTCSSVVATGRVPRQRERVLSLRSRSSMLIRSVQRNRHATLARYVCLDTEVQRSTSAEVIQVRCDAASLGVPCTNCVAFSIECKIPVPKRKKNHASKAKEGDRSVQWLEGRKACSTDNAPVTETLPRTSRLTMMRNTTTRTTRLPATLHQRRHRHISCRKRRRRSRSLSLLSLLNS